MKAEKYYKKAVKVWSSMLQRCYDNKVHNQEQTYIGCQVCDEWLNFSLFYSWFKDNYYELPCESIQLDKDIIVKNNKLYSPERCCFVPHTINSLFTKNNKNRGTTPIGVSWIKRDKVYRAQCNDGYKNRVGLGDYHDPITAFKVYKDYKEKIIKEIADKYKVVLKTKTYQALYKYEVEITD